MAKSELSKSKSLCILAVVVSCFAILWPKIFLPMLQSALSLSSTPNENQRSEYLHEQNITNLIGFRSFETTFSNINR